MDHEVTEPRVETNDATLTSAGLPPSSQYWVRAADAVMAAYTAYNNGQNNNPTLPGYHDFASIKAFEADPNLNPFKLVKDDAVVTGPAGVTSPSPGYQLLALLPSLMTFRTTSSRCAEPSLLRRLATICWAGETTNNASSRAPTQQQTTVV